MRINNDKQNFKSLSVLAKPLGAFYNANATIPTLIIESGVTAGRSIEANKRGGKMEATERLVEQGVSAVVWIWGVQALKKIGDFIGKKALNLDLNFDVGFDVLRNPIKNNKISSLAKNYKVGNLLVSTALATYFTGFVIPKINHKISSKINEKSKKEQATALTNVSFEDFENNSKKQENKEIAFTSLADKALSLAHTLENNQTTRLLITDSGVVAGRFHNSRNKYEKIESLFRDISSIYFYLFSTNHFVKLMNKITGNTDISPKALKSTVEMLQKQDFSSKDFLKTTLGEVSKEQLDIVEELFNQKQVINVEEFVLKFPELKAKAFDMAKLQPIFEGNGVLTKQQAKDVLNNGLVSDPKFLKDMLSKATDGASSDKLRFVKKENLEKIRNSVDKFIKEIDSSASKSGQKIDSELIKKIANKNIFKNFAFYSIGTAISIYALGILIPKVQYFITKKLTKQDKFPGATNYEK